MILYRDLSPRSCMLLDIHTHRLPSDPSTALFSYFPGKEPPPVRARYLSAGLHPWYLSDKPLPERLEKLEQQLADRRVLAIGEVGLDKCCPVPWELQEQAFEAVVRLAEEREKPIVIHNVRATAELMAVRKRIRARQPWVMHGFRGKKELAESWIRQGCYLSFGERYVPDTLQSVPLDRLLMETDDSQTDIRQLYARAAALRRLPVEQLEQAVGHTADFLFF